MMHGKEVMSDSLSYCLCLLWRMDCIQVQWRALRQAFEHFAQNNFSRSILKKYERSSLCLEAIGQG